MRTFLDALGFPAAAELRLAKRGEVGEAERQFERVLSYATDLRLFSEEIDPESGVDLAISHKQCSSVAKTSIGVLAAFFLKNFENARH